LHNKCIFCGFEGDEFEEIIKSMTSSSNGGFENMIQVAILLKCPKCGYQRRCSYGYSNDKRISEKMLEE
jgi:uncharacterized Zn finger protein